MIKHTFLLLLIINYSYSKVHKCAQVPIITDFDLEKYSGTWYEIASFPFYPEKNLKCVQAVYETLDSKTSSFKHSGIRVFSKKCNYTRSGTGVIRSICPHQPNKLKVIYDAFIFKLKGHYNVWKTDYDHYSLVYTCEFKNIFDFRYKKENAWILSRNRTLDSKYINDLKNELTNANVDASLFEPSDQTDCDSVQKCYSN